MSSDTRPSSRVLLSDALEIAEGLSKPKPDEKTPTMQQPKRVSSPFLLSGIARCGYCGKALVGKYVKSGKSAYYVCGTLDKKGGGSCKAQYLNANRFENLVIERIKESVLTRDNLTELVQLVNEETDSLVKKYESELHLISNAIIDVNLRLEWLYDAIKTGKINLDDLVPRIHDSRRRQEQLHYRRTDLENYCVA